MAANSQSWCDHDPDCPPEIAVALARIEAAAGAATVSTDNPCGLIAYYDEGEPKPWRLADDWATETYCTAEEAEDAASEWTD